jgi:hypothetical protein
MLFFKAADWFCCARAVVSSASTTFVTQGRDCAGAESTKPILVLGAVHLKHITDLAWSPCGCFLAATSHDGYCTIAHFGAGELGTPLTGDIPDAQAIRLDMQRQRQSKVCTAAGSAVMCCVVSCAFVCIPGARLRCAGSTAARRSTEAAV